MKVTFTISGIRNNKGLVRGLAFSSNSSKGFPEDMQVSVAKAETKAASGSVTLVFDDVPTDTASFSFFHDEKSSGKIEKNFLGIPKSGVGASNWSGKGRPSFSKSLIKVSSEGQARLYYF